MSTFLEELAQNLYGRYGSEVSSLSILFPSKRARVFFSSALAQVVSQPIWQLEQLTIDDLMCEVSGLYLGERIRLITELYRVYSQYHKESFDKFYFWGDMLLADFDMIDKYMIDADMLFRNISDIKEIESDISYLTPEQLKILSFWMSFKDGANLSKEQYKFLEIWRSLPKIYHKFRARLTELNIAYTGMIQRRAVERIKAGDVALKPRRYVIAGFNALSECEKRLFKYLDKSSDVEFYWDYDIYYKNHKEQEAGMFIRDNLVMFPPKCELSCDNFSKKKELTVVSALSNVVQCKYVSEIITKLMAQGAVDENTAIVLTDENLLLPVLYSLPKQIGKVNVTMGYHLRQSLAYSFIERLLELQHHRRTKGGESLFYHVDVLGILSHPYVSDCDKEQVAELQDSIVKNRRIYIDQPMLHCGEGSIFSAIFSATSCWRELSNYIQSVVARVAHMPYDGDEQHHRVEFLSLLLEHLVKLHNSLEMCDLKELTVEIYASLLRKHLQTVRVPFEGEPLEGLQVMGILETRNLDFENVIILSMNDDNFPGNKLSAPSFVPYNLRAAYGIPTPEHHEGVYAYYFYRLVQRAQKVWMLYCSQADDKSTGEPSRYIHQLRFETDFEIRNVEASVDVNMDGAEPIVVEKSGEILEQLERYVDSESGASLSPTSFFRYVQCPLKFYFYSIARLKSDDDLSEDVDAPMFGTILHEAISKLYGSVVGEQNPGKSLARIVKSGDVERAVEESINENYLKVKAATEADYTGNLILVKSIVVKYIENGAMRYDVANDDFAVVAVEGRERLLFDFESASRKLTMKFEGIVDRLDSLNGGMLRVVDYKTGRPHLEFMGVDPLFNGEPEQRVSNVFQTLLYSMMLFHSRKRDVIPSLYYVRSMNRDDYSPLLIDKERKQTGACYSEYAEEFEALVRSRLSEMFDPGVAFTQCEDETTCIYCDFKALCRRAKSEE